jgi:MoxR-like ATPase
MRDRFLEGIERIFELFKCDPETREMITLSMLVRNCKTLFLGTYGVGKTVLVNLIAKTFFDDDKAMITLDPSLTPFDLLYWMDIAELMQGKEKIYPRELVTRRMKFINEFGRGNQKIYNSFLSLMAEGRVVFRDKVFDSPPYVWFFDLNPTDEASVQVPASCMDRIDCAIPIPLLHLRDSVDLMLTKDEYGFDLTRRVDRCLSSAEMEQIWNEVEQIKTPKMVYIWCSMIAEMFRACTKTEKSLIEHATYELRCKGCEFNGEICSFLKKPLAHRMTESAIKLARARAWLHGRSKLEMDDVEFVLPYTLHHRIELREEIASLHPSKFEWLRKTLSTILGIKRRIWSQALTSFHSILQKNEVQENLKKLQSLSKNDLVVRTMLDWAEQELGMEGEEVVKKVEDLVAKGRVAELDPILNGELVLPPQTANMVTSMINTAFRSWKKKLRLKDPESYLEKLASKGIISAEDIERYVEQRYLKVVLEDAIIVLSHNLLEVICKDEEKRSKISKAKFDFV